MRGQKNGESTLLGTFLSPFRLLKQVYKAELEGITISARRGTPKREEDHFSPGLGEYCFLTSAGKSSFLQNDR